jgi:hypothetical protein
MNETFLGIASQMMVESSSCHVFHLDKSDASISFTDIFPIFANVLVARPVFYGTHAKCGQ